MFVYELSGSGFKSSCSHLKFRFRACFEQGVPWHSGNYRVWIHSEMHMWHDKNIQSIVISICHLTWKRENLQLCILWKNMHGIACLTGNRHVIIIHLLISTQPGLLTEFFWMKWILHNLWPDIKVEMWTFNYHEYHKMTKIWTPLLALVQFW